MSEEKYSAKEKENLDKAFAALDQWFETHAEVDTPFGKQDTDSGYQLLAVRCAPTWIRLSVYVLSRSIRKQDLVRNGDEVDFLYNIRKNTIGIP